MDKHEYKPEGNCYVYVQGNDRDIELFYDIVGLSKDNIFILYPERSMTFVDSVCYRPYVKSVVTENPFVIATYSRNSVWVLKKGKWVNPDIQTYGASVENITDQILHFSSSIPIVVLSGVDGIAKYRKIVKEQSQITYD